MKKIEIKLGNRVVVCFELEEHEVAARFDEASAEAQAGGVLRLPRILHFPGGLPERSQ